MVKTLTNVGNSKAIIIPKNLIDKYHLERVSLEEVDGGIMIVPQGRQISFQEKVEVLRSKKAEVYARMNKQANDPDVIEHYQNESIDDIDLDIED